MEGRGGKKKRKTQPKSLSECLSVFTDYITWLIKLRSELRSEPQDASSSFHEGAFCVYVYVHGGRRLCLFLEKPSDTLQRIPNLKQCKMLHQTCFTVLTLLPVKSTPVTVSETFWIISWLCFACCWAESSWKMGQLFYSPVWMGKPWRKTVSPKVTQNMWNIFCLQK